MLAFCFEQSAAMAKAKWWIWWEPPAYPLQGRRRWGHPSINVPTWMCRAVDQWASASPRQVTKTWRKFISWAPAKSCLKRTQIRPSATPFKPTYLCANSALFYDIRPTNHQEAATTSSPSKKTRKHGTPREPLANFFQKHTQTFSSPIRTCPSSKIPST